MSKQTKCELPAVPLEYCEQAVKELYRRIQVPVGVMQHLRQRVSAEMAELYSETKEERRELEKQRPELEARQQKLFDLYYTDTINATVMAQEQKVLDADLASVNRRLDNMAQIEEDHDELIEVAMKLAANCHRLYSTADDLNKHLLNTIFLDQVLISYVHDENHHTHAHTHPWVSTFRPTQIVNADNNPDEYKVKARPAEADTLDLEPTPAENKFRLPEGNITSLPAP